MTYNAADFNQGPSHMSQPSNGITPEVIREIMPPYQLSPDLLQATLAALPRPPPDATPAWRHARIARITQEISTLMPANAAQARIAAQVLIYRELADTLATHAHASGTDFLLMSRLARTADALVQTATSLRRSLTRDQQKPAAFFGTVLSDQVDIPALDATWHRTPDDQPQPAPDAAVRRGPDPPNPSPPAPPTRPPAALTSTEPQPQPDRPPHPAAAAAPDATATSEWTRTLLDAGPGWSREVLRHRSSLEAQNATSPSPLEGLGREERTKGRGEGPLSP
jgi:hypothetical protein